MIRVLLVDDHQIVIDGIRSILDKQPDIEVVGTALSGAAAITAVTTHPVDVVLMDIQMDDQGDEGLVATRQLKEDHPEVAVIILSMHEYYSNALDAGANGYLLKNSGEREILEAIKAVAAGGKYLSRDATEGLFNAMRNPEIQRPSEEVPTVTPRERDVVCELVKGKTNKEIANALNIGESTVATHIRNMLEKTGNENRTSLAMWATLNNICDTSTE